MPWVTNLLGVEARRQYVLNTPQMSLLSEGMTCAVAVKREHSKLAAVLGAQRMTEGECQRRGVRRRQ